MLDWFEIEEGQQYRHKLTGTAVRVRHVDNDEGFSGLVEWEVVGDRKIEGVAREVQEEQHFVEDFDLIAPRPSEAAA